MVSSELIDVLFWRNIKEFLHFYKDINEKYYPNNLDEYTKQLNKYLYDNIKTKANFINIIEDYNINGKTIWQEQETQNCDYLNQSNIIKALKNGSSETGEKRYLSYEDMKKKWAYHLDDYANAVNYCNNINILELATGAGLGTCAVMKNLLPNNMLISVDIDFKAVKNADGLAQYFNITDRVCGLNANFWCLPFDDGTFDGICTHYGIDESGEIPTVIKETSRVLKSTGRFVLIARKNPYDRHRNIMEMFDINESECPALLKRARLYSGFDDLIEIAAKQNLSLIKHKLYEPKKSHHRYLYIFQKL